MGDSETTQEGRGREGWRPTEEFYLSDPRSARIRQVALKVTSQLDDLLHDPNVAANPERSSDIYARLEILNGQLLDLEVQPHMHEGQSPEFFKASPVTTAEYLAGQLMGLTGRQIPSERATKPITGEFSTSEKGMPHVIEPGGMPEGAKDRSVSFNAVRSTVQFVNRNFAPPPKAPPGGTK